MSDQVARLQAAVNEMLAELNAEAGDRLWGFDGYDGAGCDGHRGLRTNKRGHGMSDIIQDAKQLLDGTTPALWEPHPDVPKCLVNLEAQFAVAVVPESDVAGSEDEANRSLIAAAPEFAQALAEETWEYGVEYKYLTNRGAEWRLDPDVGWHETYRAAEHAASASVRFRIVRRRVSQPEVIG